MRAPAIVLSLVLILGILAPTASAQENPITCGTEENTSLVLAFAMSDIGLQLTTNGIAEFQEICPHIAIEILGIPLDHSERQAMLLERLQAKDSEIDVLQIEAIETGSLAEHLVDLRPLLSSNEINSHFTVSIQNNTVDGKLVALPWSADTGLLFYRADLLSKHGFSAPPATWNELTAMAQAIMTAERDAGNDEFYGFLWAGNASEDLTASALEWQYAESETQIINPESGEIEVLSDAAIGAFERAATWVGTISPENSTVFDSEDLLRIWDSGNAAFMRNWFSIQNRSAIAAQSEVAPLPSGSSGRSSSIYSGWELAVSKYSDSPEAAAALVAYLSGQDQQRIRAIEGVFLPTIADLYQDQVILDSSPNFSTVADVLDTSIARPSAITGSDYSEVSALYSRAVHSILTGEEDAAVALELLALDLGDLLGK